MTERFTIDHIDIPERRKATVDYKAIADRLVERGIGERDQPNLPHSNQVYYYAPDTHPDEPNDDEGFCHDWRVARACLERMTDGMLIKVMSYRWLRDPFEIILDYLEATNEK